MARPCKTLTALALAVVMVLSMPLAAFAELPDIQGHWAENMISSTVEKGLLEGYPDGTFRPEEPMTQAEFFTIINRSFGFGRAEDLSMPAIASGAWYAAELIKAKAQGYLDILGEGVLMPDKPISREMAAAILGKVMRLEPDDATANGFGDATGFAPWAKGMSGAVVGHGYMQGYRDDTFKPDKYISRAEVSTIMYRVVGELYKEPGVYGEEQTTTTINGNATVSSPNITLRNMVIQGDLYLTEGIAGGSVTLENVTVKGTVIVGGGAEGIFLKDSKLEHMVVSTPDGVKSYVSAQGRTSIGPVKIYSGAILEEAGLSGAGFGDILIQTPRDSNTELSGNFDRVEAASAATRLSILKGAVKLLEINGTDTNVELGNSVSIVTLTVNKPAKITGNCTIGTANINSSNVTVMARPNKVNIAAGLTGVYCIAAAPAVGSSGGGSRRGGGGGGGGGSGDEELTVKSVVGIAAITVENGTSKGYIGLPGKVKVTLSDNSKTNLNVNWNNGEPEYNGYKAGTYKFSGSLVLKDDIKNPDGLNAKVSVIVKEAPAAAVEIVGVVPVNDITVENGTLKGAIGLPKKATVKLSDTSTKSLEVSWDNGTPEYNGDKAGTYEFSGTLTLVNDIKNPKDMKAKVAVIVKEAEQEEIIVTGVETFSDVNVENGTEITVVEAVYLPETAEATFSIGEPRELDIDWDIEGAGYDGNTEAVYTFEGDLQLPEGVANPQGWKAWLRVAVGKAISEEVWITAVDEIADIAVDYGTGFEALSLPDSIGIVLNNGDASMSAGVEWDNTGYDGNAPGTYTLQGALVNLPAGVVNSGGLKAAVKVTVGEPEPITVIGIAPIDDMTVAIGTAKEAVDLPATVQVSLSNGTTTDLGITWNRDASSYDGNILGTYIFQGTLILTGGIEAADTTVKVKVTVGPLTVASVAAIADFSVTIGTAKDAVSLPATVQGTLSNGSSTDLAITWDRETSSYDGNTLGTYAFQGTLVLPYGVEATNPNVSVNVTVIPHSVVSVAAIADFSVAIGIAKEEVGLPATVKATLSNDTTADLGITWDRETSLYDGNILGTYAFQGILVLPYGVAATNPNVSINVTVIPHTVSSVAAISDFSVAIGTPKEAVNLPATVQATISNGTTTNLAITWDRETSLYDGNTLGTYNFKGTLVPPYGIVASDPDVSVNVTVANIVVAVGKIDSITVERGTAVETVLPVTVTATLNNGTTTDLQVVWDGGVPPYDPAKSDAYKFTGILTMPTGTINPSGLKASVVVHSRVGAGTTLYNIESLTGIQQSVTASVYLDESNSLYGTASINLTPLAPVVVDANSSYCTVLADGIPGKAFSSMDNLEFSLYTPDPSKIEYFLVKFYTDKWHGIFYENGIGGWELNTGWNKIRRRASDFDYIDSVGGTTAATSALKTSRTLSVQDIDSIAEKERKMKESIELINSLESSRKRPLLRSSSTLSAAVADTGESITAMEIYMVYKTKDKDGNPLTEPSVNIDRIGYDITGSTKILFTFDDAWRDVLTYGKPILDAKGFKATTWANLDAMSYAHEDKDPALWLMNGSELASIYADPVGWDIGNHTVNHLDTLPDAETMRSEYLTNQEWLISKGWTRGAYHVCYPSGQYSDELIDILKDIGVKSARTTVHGIQPVPTPDIYKLKCVNVSRDTNIDTPSTTEEPITDKIDRAIATGSSLMFMFHRVEPSPEPNDGGENYGALAVSTANFTRLVDYIYNYVDQGKAEVVTISQWYDYYMELDK